MAIMRKNFVVAAIAVIMMLMLSVSCGEKEPKVIDITGTWNLTSIETRSAQFGDQTVDVYVTFFRDGTFNLHQQVGAGRFQSFSGTWVLDGSMLSGKYSNGNAWGATYEAEVLDGGDVLVLTSQGTVQEVDTYRKCDSVPDLTSSL